jgi:hypothetical protein
MDYDDWGHPLIDFAQNAAVRTICAKIIQGAKNNETVMLTPTELAQLLPWAKDQLEELLPYDKNFGDDRACRCGHPYYRHFDSYDNMHPVGCKYCACFTFNFP